MKFSCPKCALTGSIDGAKLPPAGMYASCPKCGERFLIRKERTAPAMQEDFSFDALPEDTSRNTGFTGARHTDPPLDGAQSCADSRAGFAEASDDRDDMRVFIGKKADKYLRKFGNFSTGTGDGFAATWHWPAFFVPFWWFIYRKLYLWALLALVLSFLSFIPWVGLLARIGFAISANYLYFGFVKNKVREINANYPETATVEMARAGGVNNVAIVVAPLIFIAVAGVLAAIAIPQYAAYRAKAANATAMTELRKAETCVDNYYNDHNTNPDSLEQADCTISPELDVHFAELTPDHYTLVASSPKGDRVFAARSDEVSLLYRMNNDKNGEFVPVK